MGWNFGWQSDDVSHDLSLWLTKETFWAPSVDAGVCFILKEQKIFISLSSGSAERFLSNPNCEVYCDDGTFKNAASSSICASRCRSAFLFFSLLSLALRLVRQRWPLAAASSC